MGKSYPHPPPGIRRFIWRWKIKIESTFGMAMMETWEKTLIITILLFITFLFWASVITYYPGHLAYLSRRFSYYVYDDETVDVGSVFKHWVGTQVGNAWRGVKTIGGGVKEL